MKKIILSIVFICLFSGISFSQNINGLWEGKWTGYSGHEFYFVLSLNNVNGEVEGYFTWKFTYAPAGDWYYKNRTGDEAVEYIRGKYTGSNPLEMEGYAKDDPLVIIELDKYKLNFNPDGETFSGSTGNHGTWLGKIEGHRINIP